MKFLFGLVITVTLFLPKVVLAHTETQVIEMTPSGFEPAEVVVDQNSSLIFLNKDTKARWPASNVHPTHDLYSEFDPRRPIQPGESWTFKPQKVGRWIYHDHLLPHIRGTVTVISEDGPASPAGGQVQASTWQQNFKDFIEQIIAQIKNIFSFAQKEDGVKIWQDLKQKYKGQSGSAGDIHDQAHLSGSLIFQQKGFDGIASCSGEFAYGCYHGFLDEAFKNDLSKLADAYNACAKLGAGLSGPVASCIHGIGHGVASFHGADLKKSLSSCRKLTSGREYCFDGVFMEFVRSAPDSAFKKEDPLYPCNTLEQQFGPTYSFSCGRNQPSLLIGRFKMQFDEVVGICGNAESVPFKQACFDSLGFSLASTADPDQIIKGCQTIGLFEYVQRCVKAAAGELVFQQVPGWWEKSQTVCNGFSDVKSECLEYVNKLIKDYGRKLTFNFPQKKDSQDINSYIRNQLKICFDIGGRDGCYNQVAQVLYSQFGLSKTLQTLKANEDYPEVYARCHEVTHYLSRFEYEKQKSIAKVYAQCDSTCHGGCYHGTVEAFLKESLDYARDKKTGFDLSRDFAKICGKQEDYQKPIEFNECLHGLGHAGMFIYEMELNKSLVLCDSLGKEEYIDRCYTGVFMENSSSSTSFDHASIYIKKDDPFYPCNALEEKYQSTCWQYQSSYFSIINNQDWKKVANMCLQIPQKYQDKCFRTIGTNQVGFTPSLSGMKEDCDLMPEDHFKDVCVGGVVSSLSYRFVGDSKKIIEFCSMVNPDNKETCFKQMGTGILDWDKNREVAKIECSKIPDQAEASWCMSVI